MFHVQHPSTELFGRYIASVRSAGTAYRYEDSAKKFIAWCGESGWPALKGTPKAAVANYCAALVEGGYAPASVQMQLAGVRRYLKWARMQDESVPHFHDPEIPKNGGRVRDALPLEMFKHYFRLADELDEPLRTAVMLLPTVGLRGTELVTQPIDCLRRIKLRLEDGTTKATLAVVVTGKGGDERVVPLLDEGAQLVMGYLRGWRRTHPDTQWLFPCKTGHLGGRTLRQGVQTVREPLGMQFTPHTMRRTYLTTLYRHGVPAVTLAKIAGHKSVNTLMTHYLDLNEVDLATAVHNAGATLD